MAIATLHKDGGSPVPRPVCAICADRTRGRTVALRLTHGVVVWLCEPHASPEFQVRRGGRDFVSTLERLWQAHGCLTAARKRALAAHIEALADPPERERPGSYTWPALRLVAEREFARGGPPLPTIHRLRRRFADGPAAPPSVRTMLRWHHERRWLDLTPSSSATPSAGPG
jgi:hypothetical protein